MVEMSLWNICSGTWKPFSILGLVEGFESMKTHQEICNKPWQQINLASYNSMGVVVWDFIYLVSSLFNR